MTDAPRVLILYSNPVDTGRLRLDAEHRAIDAVLDKRHLPHGLVRRAHATSVEDFAELVRKQRFDVIQFSGHGSPDGIFLDRGVHGSDLVTPKQLAAILRDTCPSLRAALFIACFTSEGLGDLIDVARYLITVTGVAEDDSAIHFVEGFYDRYVATNSIEGSFHSGCKLVEFHGKESGIKAVFTERATVRGQGRALIRAFPGMKPDSILVDVTDAEPDIAALDVSREQFLSILTRKIRTHGWPYGSERDHAIIPIGRYFGEFSWTNSDEIVNCHHILVLRDDVDDATCDAFAVLVVRYNELTVLPYRSALRPADAEQAPLLLEAVNDLTGVYTRVFGEEQCAAPLRAVAPRQFQLSESFLKAYLESARRNFDARRYSETINQLEFGVSGVHDLVDAVVAAVTVSPSKQPRPR